MSKISESKRSEFESRLREDLPAGMRIDFDEFTQSFPEDIIGDLVRQFGGWNSPKTFSMVRAVSYRMMEAWQFGREKLREEISEIL